MVHALLATICRAATVVQVSEGPSQLKWHMFAQNGRSLRKLKVSGETSREPWNSLRMAATMRGMYTIVTKTTFVNHSRSCWSHRTRSRGILPQTSQAGGN